jgi:hypothetical protein
MGLRRYANKRDTAEQTIVKALEDMSCLVIRMDKPVDLLVQIPGVRQIILAEVKTGKGKLTEEQEAFISRGWEVWILRDVQDAINMVNMVRRMAA